jgi:DNA repair exonuclease SbcCD ATPase subunit
MTKKIKLRRKKCVCIYAGSTVQQNFGESELKGYLIWNIHDKDRHTVEKRLFRSPRPFITVSITEDGQLPNRNVPRNARLRLVCEHNLPRARMSRLKDYAMSKWSPYSVQLVNKSTPVATTDDQAKSANVRDPNVFDEYLSDFLKTKEIKGDVQERTMEIGREYFKKHVASDSSRNVTWKLSKMKWDYLFNYGKGNTLDFSKLNGLVGIFGKNYSGKSSIIDAALFGLFNTTSKGEKRNVHIINQNQERASCKLEIAIGDDVYEIARSLEKTTGKSKGREVERAKTELDFTKLTYGTQAESKNGDTRNKTDENIQGTFGTIRDFMMTSFAAQNDSLGFVSEGSTKRKEILAKFLDLEIFDDMHKAVKKDSSEMRGKIKHLNSVDWEKKLKRALSEYSEILEEIAAKTDECDKSEARLNVLREEQSLINSQVEAASQKDIDIDALNKALLEAQNSLLSNEEELSTLVDKLSSKSSQINDLEPTIASLQEQATRCEEQIQTFEMLKVELRKEQPQLDKLQRKVVNLQSKIDMLHDHEYDPDCSFCCNNEFVKKAEDAKVQIVGAKEQVEDKKSIILDLKMKCSLFDEDDLTSKIKEAMVAETTLSNLQSEVKNLSLKIDSVKSKAEVLRHKIPSIQADISYYNENIEAYENLGSLRRDLKAINSTISLKERQCKKCQNDLLELMSEKGSTKRTIEEAREGIQKIKDAERDYIAYDLFVQATHPNGISYQVIKSMLSVINAEISSVLSSIVDFEVFFDDDGDSLEIYLKHPNYDPRPLSMGSGAEKTIASMAVRLALISVSSLPRSDFFILDEPATALDAEHMEGFVRLLQMIKAQFKTVLLITHLESLKDVVDKTIEIDKIDGYAQVKL